MRLAGSCEVDINWGAVPRGGSFRWPKCSALARTSGSLDVRRSGPASRRCSKGSPSSTPRAASRCPTRSATRSRGRCGRPAPTWARATPPAIRVGEILEEAERKAARFLGCEPHEVIFGPNMTSLNFTLSRTAARGFAPGDEILVSCLDHDGGVAPWLEIAHDRDLVVRHVAAARRHDAATSRTWSASSGRAPRWSRSPGRQTRSARSPTPGGCASSRTTPARSPGSTPSTTRRTSRSTSGTSAPTC